MIVVLSHPDDPHAARVMKHLTTAGQDHVLLNLSHLPDRASVTVDYADPAAPGIRYAPADGAELDLGAATAAWWRRPQAARPETISDPSVAMFTHNEWHEALAGLWRLLPVRWMNDPVRDEAASRKAYQLKAASEAGLLVPRTLVTSDPDRARCFIHTHGIGRTIFKTFSCTHEIWRETRLVRNEDLAQLDAVRLAPVIFQEYVEAEADLRITSVGGRLFVAAIDARGSDYEVDFRMSLGQARTSSAELPQEVQAGIHRLMRCLGLEYGAIDMRRTPSGQHVFLEVNTAGEFLFVEERTGLPISEAVAEWLTRPGTPSPGRARRATRARETTTL